MEQRRTVIKLRDDNYYTWSFQMEVYFKSLGIWGVISGDDDDIKVEDGVEPEQRAFTEITLSVTESQLVHIIGCESAQETWNNLKSVHNQASAENAFYLNQELRSAQYEEGTSMQEHLNHMKQLRDKLTATGDRLSEMGFAMLILGSLPESYQTVSLVLQSMEKEKLTYNLISSRLLIEERRQKMTNGTAKDERALAATKNYHHHLVHHHHW